MRRVVGFLILLALAPPAAIDAGPIAAEPASLVDRDLALTRLDGTRDDLAALDGKTLVLNVWATWCAPCRRELPSLQRLADAAPADVVVLGIAVDRDADFVREYLRDIGIRYVNYIDPEQRVGRTALGVDRLPQTLVIAPDGRARRIVGAADWSDPAAARLIARQSRR
jgi:thiol-disulfide isomerase/thioredoxin